MHIKPFAYLRRPSRPVYVGQVLVGGNAPIRVQSMTTNDTKDTLPLVKEIEGLVHAGCEIVRVTVPTQADCDNLPNVRAEMKKRGIKVPLVADIHFTPSIALKAVEYVEKVRINPGNFVDKKLFKVFEYTDAQYVEEMERIAEKFSPLVKKCKEYGVAMRIGTNHGSLSDRIMNRFGDTAEGMVESALEFARVAEDHGFHDIVFSMKASNVQVMVEAYRLLALRLQSLGKNYPFHLGVTEAGAGAEGRIKSAIGIGALLEEGIGDTIRVSLTEDSIHEVPVAFQIVQKYNQLHSLNLAAKTQTLWLPSNKTSSTIVRRKSPVQIKQGGENPIRVWVGLSGVEKIAEVLQYQSSRGGKDRPIEGVELSDLEQIDPAQKQKLAEAGIALSIFSTRPNPSLSLADKVVIPITRETGDILPLLRQVSSNAVLEFHLQGFDSDPEGLNAVVQVTHRAAVQCEKTVSYSIDSSRPVRAYPFLARVLDQNGLEAGIHLRYKEKSNETALISSSIDLGSLLLKGFADSIQVDAEMPIEARADISYNILQGCRLRISRTEYISCPSCGRTQFDLQSTTERIRSETAHLKGLKIAVMGCIVNGPGEMADADFGYVGTGPKKVSLYVGKECVERNISEENALARLVGLIKDHGRWVEPAA